MIKIAKSDSIKIAYSHSGILFYFNANLKCVRSTRMPGQAQIPWYPSQLTSFANGHDENSMLRQGGA